MSSRFPYTVYHHNVRVYFTYKAISMIRQQQASARQVAGRYTGYVYIKMMAISKYSFGLLQFQMAREHCGANINMQNLPQFKKWVTILETDLNWIVGTDIPQYLYKTHAMRQQQWLTCRIVLNQAQKVRPWPGCGKMHTFYSSYRQTFHLKHRVINNAFVNTCILLYVHET